ncbi:DUF3566 domain-containing protein [Tessaracoccus sp. Z1128]
MSENPPRWPSASGAPGLDFSAQRPPEGNREQPSPPSMNGSVPAPAGSGATTDEPSVTPAHAGPAFSPTPAAADDGGPTDATTADAANDTRTIPAVAGRAARVAQEWASKAKVVVADAVSRPPATLTGPPVEPGAVVPPVVTTPSRAATFERVEGSESSVVTPATRASRRTRKARLRLSRIDPWSVMKTTFLFSIAFGVMMVVAAFVLWSVLAGSGALESANAFINTLIGDQDTAFNIADLLSMTRVLGFATVVAAVDVVIITAVATLFAFLYNLAATVMGGLEVTLAED